jgi:hypothetical protein
MVRLTIPYDLAMSLKALTNVKSEVAGVMKFNKRGIMDMFSALKVSTARQAPIPRMNIAFHTHSESTRQKNMDRLSPPSFADLLGVLQVYANEGFIPWNGEFVIEPTGIWFFHPTEVLFHMVKDMQPVDLESFLDKLGWELDTLSMRVARRSPKAPYLRGQPKQRVDIILTHIDIEKYYHEMDELGFYVEYHTWQEPLTFEAQYVDKGDLPMPNDLMVYNGNIEGMRA